MPHEGHRRTVTIGNPLTPPSMAVKLLTDDDAMSDQVVVMSGPTRLDLKPLEKVAREFGWVVGTASDPQLLALAFPYRKPVAVLFHRDAMGSEYSWPEALRRAHALLPEVRIIACHGFAEYVNWPELRSAGAFHALPIPLRENEVRQSLGFVLDAEKRLADASANLLHSGLALIPRRIADSVTPFSAGRKRAAS